MVWIKRAWGVAAVLATLPSGACGGTHQVVGSDESAVGGSAAAGIQGGSRTAFIEQFVATAQNPCLPTPLPLSNGAPTCDVTVARHTTDCTCNAPGNAPVSEDVANITRAQLEAGGVCGGTNGAEPCTNYCVCAVQEATGNGLTQCQTAAQPSADASGWCYVSSEQGAAQAALVADCPAGQQHELRLIGDALPQASDTYFIACEDSQSEPRSAALGEVCLSTAEYSPEFAGFDPRLVSVDTSAASCASQVCLKNHFQGLVNCVAGQSAGSGGCIVPGNSEPVSVAVQPQLVGRQATVASTCSCRCAGNGPGPYCTCPESMACEHLVDPVGLPGDDEYAGSYCVPKGSEYNVDQTGLGNSCRPGYCGL